MGHDDVVSSMVLELRRGTLVMLVLSQLREPAYGYALVKSLADHGIPIEANTLYPLMRRLEAQGLLASEWDNGGSKPRKYYRTTDEGLRVLREVEEQWRVLCGGVNALLRAGEDADGSAGGERFESAVHVEETGNGEGEERNDGTR
ncbi:PadR family transcriptional regulator [Gordonibacter sp. 28C]|uniref:PadR family transcriptional regulator n=1 Tax=Gordonibacter sp. 28C TaxID=2078569 RepID=UPI001F542659|nr:PadR family transcriptional regulator [Gordonibacter sp. 28C]